MSPVLILDNTASDIPGARANGSDLWVSEADLGPTGWEIKSEGICRGPLCVSVPPDRAAALLKDEGGQTWLNMAEFARFTGQSSAADDSHGIYYFAPWPDNTRDSLKSLLAPDFTLPDLQGQMHSLSDYRGKKVALVLWASWCSCRFDMPQWSALREELKDQNFEVVTVACDAKGNETAEPFITPANPQHPSLIDRDFRVSELYNTRNVPSVFWIDEDGKVVRGNDPAGLLTMNRETNQNVVNEAYLDAVRDWVAKGPASAYVTPPAVTGERIGTSDAANDSALAEFRLGKYLQEQGLSADAIQHFKRAHELKPENWNYRRQAWALGNIETDYGTTFRDEMQKGIPFRPPLDLTPAS